MTVQQASVVTGRLKFDSGAVLVDSAVAWVLIATLRAFGKRVTLRGAVTTNGLKHLKVTQAAIEGGTHSDLVVDGDLITASYAVPICLYDTGTLGPHETPAAGSFQLVLDSGAAEYSIYAKKDVSNASLQLTGSIG